MSTVTYEFEELSLIPGTQAFANGRAEIEYDANGYEPISIEVARDDGKGFVFLLDGTDLHGLIAIALDRSEHQNRIHDLIRADIAERADARSPRRAA